MVLLEVREILAEDENPIGRKHPVDLPQRLELLGLIEVEEHVAGKDHVNGLGNMTVADVARDDLAVFPGKPFTSRGCNDRVLFNAENPACGRMRRSSCDVTTLAASDIDEHTRSQDIQERPEGFMSEPDECHLPEIRAERCSLPYGTQTGKINFLDLSEIVDHPRKIRHVITLHPRRGAIGAGFFREVDHEEVVLAILRPLIRQLPTSHGPRVRRSKTSFATPFTVLKDPKPSGQHGELSPDFFIPLRTRSDHPLNDVITNYVKNDLAEETTNPGEHGQRGSLWGICKIFTRPFNNGSNVAVKPPMNSLGLTFLIESIEFHHASFRSTPSGTP